MKQPIPTETLLETTTQLSYNLTQNVQSSTLNNTSNTFLYPTVNHIYNETAGKKETINSLRASTQGHRWETALSNEWGRLAQGNVHGVQSTDTIDFVYYNEVPKNKDVTYASFVCDHRPLKSEPWRVRIVFGGDKLTYKEDPGSPAASLLETKILLNSVISDASKGARFMSLDLKDFFLATPMEQAEYMKIPYQYFPNDIKSRYNLHKKVTSTNFIYVKIKKGMYGLKQAAILAYNNLIKILKQMVIFQSNIPTAIGNILLYPQSFAFVLMTLV